VSEHLVEVRGCQVCGSENSTTKFEEPPYRVLRCSDCGLVYVTPRWTDETIHKVYDEDYWQSESPKTKGYANYAEEARLYLKTFRRRARLVRRYLPQSGRILDVGCAAGFFLRVMREAGHDVYGIELSEPIAREAIRTLGDGHIHLGTIHDVPAGTPGIERGSFDLVTMWDVVEHIPDPQALLREARTYLKPGGHLLLETQNVDSRFASLLGPRWHHYKHEEHIYHFNPKTVRMLLDQAGFEPVRVTGSFGGKYVSFGFIVERAARIHRIAGIALKPLAMFKGAHVYLNFYDELVVIARPRGDAPRDGREEQE
jgi:2-polyprenyl-3-methyl-5-hydroxy-6-metoxy-1,4-benzoquinol methylase